MDEALGREISAHVEAMGFEIVEIEQAGSRTRPLLRMRIDRLDGTTAVTIDDCARVSRDIEAFLDAREDLGERYVLEVSSPGLERPLVKRSDYARFAGREVAIKTSQPMGDMGKRVEGVLKGINDADEVQVERDGRVVAIPQSNIKKAHLVFKWGDK